MERFQNLYKEDVDFAALALQSRDFAKYLKSNGNIDFNDPAAVRQLTVSLLQQDFDLKVELPEDRLCPPVPNRLNYIIWLRDLLDSTASYDEDAAKREVIGLDVGTGCCCIYPLLGCRVNPTWRFVATDIDDSNIRTSRQNLALNQLESRVQVVKTDLRGPLFPLEKLNHDRLAFTMCNPPFYTSNEEMLHSAETKLLPPSSACTGAEVEMVTPGGEVAFVTRMIEESLRLRDKVQWFTSMVGKFSSVSTLAEKLLSHNNSNYAVTEFVQGSKTKRWAIAWSWDDKRPKMSVARGVPGFPKYLLPFPADYTFTLSSVSIDAACKTLNTVMDSLPLFWTWDQRSSSGVVFAPENVWSRHARRKIKFSGQEGMKVDQIPDQVALGVRIELKLVRGKDETNEVQALIRWIQGLNSVLFESFCGMVKRKMETSP